MIKATRQEISRARTLTELESVAKRYGYEYPWAIRVFNARRGKYAKS